MDSFTPQTILAILSTIGILAGPIIKMYVDVENLKRRQVDAEMSIKQMAGNIEHLSESISELKTRVEIGNNDIRWIREHLADPKN